MLLNDSIRDMMIMQDKKYMTIGKIEDGIEELLYKEYVRIHVPCFIVFVIHDYHYGNI